MRFVVRADASAEIGSGHVIRCLTLAEALRAQGAEVAFVCRDHPGNLIARIEHQGFAAKRLPVHDAGWLGAAPQTDAAETIAALGDRPDWLVVDHYLIDEQWESALRPHVGRIMAIDDLADRRHASDLLLDQNLIADFEHRYDGLVPNGSRRLLGPRYALLQPEYASLHAEARPRSTGVKRIFVYFGASDSSDLTGQVIAAFLSLDRPDISMDVVIGAASRHGAAAKARAKGHANITVHESMPTLVRLMEKADLAIGASGATSWERLCLKLPAIVVTLAENQEPIARELDRRGFVHWMGDASAVDEVAIRRAILDHLADRVHPTLEDTSLVDGLGCGRVTSVLLDELEKSRGQL